MKSPILFLIFNRTATTAKVFEEIRKARPSRLYVASDGARANRPGEVDLVDEVRSIATNVDWPCKISTLFRDKNLGCGIAVSDALDWFFSNESEGIILEDDCLPSPDFFLFMDEMLEKFRDDSRIMSIAGTNINDKYASSYSYLYSKYSLMWGWATWRRAWVLNDRLMTDWPNLKEGGWLKGLNIGGYLFRRRWEINFDSISQAGDDVWDYHWIYSCWRNLGLTILPSKNLVVNIGFSSDATHTKKEHKYLSNLKASAISWPIVNKDLSSEDFIEDAFITKNWFLISPMHSIRRIVFENYFMKLIKKYLRR